MKKSIFLSGVIIVGLLVGNGMVFGNDCSYYQELVTYYENSIQQYQELAAGYSASIASQMSAQGLSSSAIASSTSSNPYASTINELQGKLIQAKSDYTNCKYSSSNSSNSSSSNYSYSSIMNSQRAVDYVKKAIDYMEAQESAYAKGDYTNAIKNAKKALEYLKTACDYDDTWDEYLINQYGRLGRYYCMDGDYSNGKSYLKKSLNLNDDDNMRELYNSCLKLEKYDTSSTTTNTSTYTRPCSQYGSHAFLDSNVNRCYCEDGYTWNIGRDTCVTYDESCKSYFGEYSIPDPSIKYSCLCKDGYEFSSDGSKCIKSLSNTDGFPKNYNNGYSDEYNRAYEFAYANKITTMPTIEQANMNGEIIRAEIAKMLANWVKSLGYTPDYSKSCNFNDISSVQGDLYTAIIESCQLGIMGQGIDDFRPYDRITKGEVSTAISRILRGSQYEGGNPYYTSHMNALKTAGVLDNINNPGVNELRGNVMTMLMKASDSDELVNCDDPITILACEVEPNQCPKACIKEGGEFDVESAVNDILSENSSLLITATKNKNGKIIGNRASELDTINFKAIDGDVTIDSITLEHFGYSNSDGIEIWLENEKGAKITNVVTMNNKGVVTLKLKNDYKTIKVKNTLKATIVINADTSAGSTIGFNLTDIVCDVKNININMDFSVYNL